MKRTVIIAVCAILCVCCLLGGCAGVNSKTPDQFKNIRWETPDYSFIINPSDSCKGTYKFNDVKYNIKAVFTDTDVTVQDTDKNNRELFYAQWTYDKENLYIYDITFNTKDYKDFKDNYAEYVSLKKGKLK